MSEPSERRPAPPATGDDAYELTLNDRRALLEGFREVDRLRVMGASTAGLAHELRSPLSALSMQVQVAQMREDLDEQSQEDLAAMLKHIRRMTQMVTTAVEFAEASRMPRMVRVHELLERIHPFYKIRMRHEGIEFEADTPEDLPAIKAVEIELAQALINLLDNAVDAVERKGGEQKVGVRAWSDDHQVHIEVSDNGAGFSDSFVAQAFAEFSVDRPGGFGLGLALARDVVTGLGGSIEITSPRNPTLVRMSLPVA